MTNNLSQGLHINSHDVKKELAKVLNLGDPESILRTP